MAAGGDMWSIGKQCALRTCRTVDFLPYQCASCEEYFCQEHRSAASHECGALRLLRTHACPNCLWSVDVMRDSQAARALAEHQCVKKTSSNRCTFSGPRGRRCPKTELVPAKCPSCQQNFCFSHVQPESHACAALAAEQNERREARAAAGKLVTKKGVEQLPLADLWVTQGTVLDAEQLFPLALFVNEGGVFSSTWSRQSEGREAMAQTFEAEVLVGSAFPIHIWQVGDVRYIFRGHSFALAVWFGGRDFLYPEEYVLRRATIDLGRVNVPVGYLLPFDPSQQIRTESFPACKREAKRIAAAATPDTVTAVVAAYAADNSHYKADRGALKSVADLFGIVCEKLAIEPQRMAPHPDLLISL